MIFIIKEKKMNDLKIKPNLAHDKIADLENKWQGEFLFVNAEHR